LAGEKPDLLVPLRGPVIRDPAVAIARLQSRIRGVYSNYLSIDALRWYFKDEHIRIKARRVLGPDAQVDWMPMAETLPLPPSIIPISNSRLILAEDGAGFLVDCGGMGIIEELRRLRASGKLKSVDHVFVTHYHDDHTDALPTLVAEFGAKVHACGSLVDLIEHPFDYRLPCLTKNPTPVTAKHNHGDSWEWKGHKVTIYDFPGQTLHHNALLVEREGAWSAFFAGDSFTPSGIDDYCLQNRNFLHEGQGFFRCLDQVEKLPPGTFVINQHVDPAFRFSPAQVQQMRDTLRKRMTLLVELLPFDDANYGLDESWAALHPYWKSGRPGESIQLSFRIMNHSPRERTFRASARGPGGLNISAPASAVIPPRSEGVVPFTVQLPADTTPGLQVITADLIWEGAELREWAEAVVEVVR
jgi:glyoxylase-like metal-dependent hydrolase (beta-lactamase superfamily II)